MKLIDKDALVAEIERIFREIGTPPHKDSNCEDWPFFAGEQQMCKTILSFINSLPEEPSSPIDFEQELYKAFGQVKDFSLGMRIAKRFYEMGRNSQQPSKVWHDASEMPYDKASCLIYYKVGDKVSYQDVFPVIYNADRKEFVSEPYPHTTGYKVEQKSLEGGVVADVYRNMRDRFPSEDISKWAYLDDIINL